MLYSVDSGTYLTKVPHQQDFTIWTSRLSPADLARIRLELQHIFSASEIKTSSWIPGDDWTGTPWEPLYEKACRRDEAAAARCFGLFVWEAVIHDKDAWGFGRYEKDGVPIEGMTYFKLHNPPPATAEALGLVG